MKVKVIVIKLSIFVYRSNFQLGTSKISKKLSTKYFTAKYGGRGGGVAGFSFEKQKFVSTQDTPEVEQKKFNDLKEIVLLNHPVSV